MKIVYVTYEYIDCQSLQIIDGGLANYLHKITTTLHKLGHDVSVIVAPANEDKQINYNGINVIFLTGKFRKTLAHRLIWPFMSYKQKTKIRGNLYTHISRCIQKLHKKSKIDIIQYTGDWGFGKYPEKKIPSCIRISSYFKIWQEYYDINDAETLKTQQEIYTNTPFLFGPSKYIADYIKRDLNLNKDIKIIESPYPDAIKNEDDTIFKNLQLEILQNPYLLFFGTIGRLKGCGVIAECIYDILAKYSNLYFVLVGKNAVTDGTDYLEMIKNKADKFANRIICFPSLSHAQLYPIIRNAVGILMPSLTENFSNACVEAMRLKKIVIGTENNFSQLLTDKESGFLAKIGNSDSLKEKIIELMSLSQAKKEQMQNRAFERTQSLSPEIICNQLLDYYRYVIAHWEIKNKGVKND